MDTFDPYLTTTERLQLMSKSKWIYVKLVLIIALYISRGIQALCQLLKCPFGGRIE